jgi:hypothetical protein
VATVFRSQNGNEDMTGVSWIEDMTGRDDRTDYTERNDK